MHGSFDKIVKNICKLEDVNPELRQKLSAYCYDIIGYCQEVHRDMGPFLNEYMYQDALAICFEERGIVGDDCKKEYHFKTVFHGKEIHHPHKVDFYIRNSVYVECKAVQSLVSEHRQQLWNYMRLTDVHIGILYNFAPVKDQCERYYYDSDSQIMYLF